MIKCVLLSFLILASSVVAEGQIGHRLFDTKRKKVEVPNYTLFLNLHDLALEYSSKIESKVDSLLHTGQLDYNNNIFDFRVRAIQTLQHVLYKSDPFIAYLDGWIYGFQMVAYLESPQGVKYLGPFQPSILALYLNYLVEWPELYTNLTGKSPDDLQAQIQTFAINFPINNNYLNRTSVIDETAHWVGEATIGFKSGVATLTDAMRNISDRLNYYTEFTPKLTQWYIEQSVRNMLGTDSLGPSLEKSVAALERMSYTVDSIDHLVYSITDTILTDVNRQRWETLRFMSAERKVILEQISSEREIVIEQLVEERKALENLIREERQASFDQIQAIVEDTTYYSFDRVDDIVDRLFFRLLILAVIIAVGLVLAVVVYKKMA